LAVRLKDIAQSLNVSIVTVSKVLNGDGNISEKTRKKVLDCAHQLGYRTNLTAKSLVTGRSRTIGLIVPDLFHGFFSEVAAHMSDELRTNNYGLLIASSREDSGLERSEVNQMLARKVDALVIATCRQSSKTLEAAAAETPLILLDRQIDQAFPSMYVGTNNLMAGRIATQHLLDQGRKRVAHIGGPSSSPSDERERAYKQVLEENGISLPKGFVVKRTNNEESSLVTGAQAMRSLLALRPRPDAVFCYNDPTAIGAMAAILAAGLSIPDDISIVGCGNIQHAPYTRVPLTSVDQNTVLLGHSAARLAMANIERGARVTTDPQEVIIDPLLVVRQSTAKAPEDRPLGMEARARARRGKS